ncbi:MAG TPA: lysylphosphatidylglycerol synthase transmembrane domain-containing protein [Pyrinomonadaceae bacterium]|nr:lysylphosphatidylglycerol synthase transmembrane domain-containing protein [Pyrinomonadaceae bacterium]
MKAYRKYIEFAALVVLAAALVWWFGRSLDWVQVRHGLRSGDWRLIAVASLVIAVAYLFRALRWQAFLAPLTPSSLREVWVATTVGFAAVLVIGRMGEVVRPVVLPMRERRVRPAASFVTIMIERIYDMMTVVFIFAINLLWFRPASGDAAAFRHVRQFGFGLVVVGAVGLLGLLWFRIKSASVLTWVENRFSAMPRLPSRLTKAVLSLLDQLGRALKVLSHPKDLALTVGWTLVMWGSVVVGNLFVFRAFDLKVSGHPFGLTESLFILGWSMLGSAVPTPGGAAGAFHAATGAGLFFLGIEKEQAAAVAIVMHLVDFGPAALFGLFYFLRGEVNFDRLRNLTKPEAVEHAVEDEKIIADSVI